MKMEISYFLLSIVTKAKHDLLKMAKEQLNQSHTVILQGQYNCKFELTYPLNHQPSAYWLPVVQVFQTSLKIYTLFMRNKRLCVF